MLYHRLFDGYYAKRNCAGDVGFASFASKKKLLEELLDNFLVPSGFPVSPCRLFRSSAVDPLDPTDPLDPIQRGLPDFTLAVPGM
jgi:hypothetical protein